MKKEISEQQQLKKIKFKNITKLDKIQELNLPNINKSTDITEPKKVYFYKKVLTKPISKREHNNLTEFKKFKNIARSKDNNNFSNNFGNFQKKIISNNNDICNNLQNRTEIDNNKYMLNATNPDILLNKVLKENNCQSDFVEQENNFSSGEKNLFIKEFLNIKNNNISFDKNKYTNKLNVEDTLGRKIVNDSNIFINRSQNNENNDLNLSLFENKRENVNINYINSISNNVYGKINSPIYLNKIYSLSNNINDNLNLINKITYKINNKNKRKLNKNLKKKILLNDMEINIDKNRTNQLAQPKNDYLNNKTEIRNSKIEGIEIDSLENKKNKTEKNNNLKFLENKKKIISSIEKQKQKLLNENYKNHIKYIKLILKQQQQYKEYDQFLRQELEKNRNSQIKLLLFKENYFNSLKKNFKMNDIITFPVEFKTLSSNDFDEKIKPKKKSIKNKIFSFNAFNNRITTDGKYMTTEINEPSLKNENSINIICKSKIRHTVKPYNRIKIKINENISKRRNTANYIERTNKITNRTKNYINFGKNISNVSHLNITYKPMSSTDRSFNNELKHFPSFNIGIKKPKKIKLDIFNGKKIIKTDNREYDKNKENKKNQNNVKKIFLSKKMVKNFGVGKTKEKKGKFKIININKDIDIKHYLNYNSLEKKEFLNELSYGQSPNNNDFKTDKRKEIHKMISHEKQKIINNLSEKRPNNKLKNKLCFSAIK